MSPAVRGATLGWGGIARLGLVQAAIGAIVMLATSLLNRIMVVEYALPAALPAALVAWHYAVQLARPLWGHGSDRSGQRTPWILGGMTVLATGALLAIRATTLFHSAPIEALLLAITGFTLIGIGVGAAGTALLALLAVRVDPARRAAAAATTWIMMIAGIAVTAVLAGALIDPFSPERLTRVAGGVALTALLVSALALWGLEGRATGVATPDKGAPGMRRALAAVWADRDARRFTLFVFVAMLAYSMQDLILEPFAGLVFGLTAGHSTQLSGAQHGGVLLGMVLAGVGGSAFGGLTGPAARRWVVGGCVGSGFALAGLAIAARVGPGWPLVANVVALGCANGIFSVAAIGAMMALAGAGGGAGEGTRLGVWGAAQAIAFGLGGLVGATGVDAARAVIGNAPDAYMLVFAIEAAAFVGAARLAIAATAQPHALRTPVVEALA